MASDQNSLFQTEVEQLSDSLDIEELLFLVGSSRNCIDQPEIETPNRAEMFASLESMPIPLLQISSIDSPYSEMEEMESVKFGISSGQPSPIHSPQSESKNQLITSITNAEFALSSNDSSSLSKANSLAELCAVAESLSRNQSPTTSPSIISTPLNTTFDAFNLSSIQESPLTNEQIDILNKRKSDLAAGILPKIPSEIVFHFPLSISQIMADSRNYSAPPMPRNNNNDILSTQSFHLLPRLTINTSHLSFAPAFLYTPSPVSLSSSFANFSTANELKSKHSSSQQQQQQLQQQLQQQQQKQLITPISPTKSAISPTKRPRTVFQCPIPGCEQTFHKEMNLQSHIKTHNSSKIFACFQCIATFRRSHDLRRHVSSLHNAAGKAFECLNCPKKFARLDALKRHVSRKGNKCYIELEEDSGGSGGGGGGMQKLARILATSRESASAGVSNGSGDGSQAIEGDELSQTSFDEIVSELGSAANLDFLQDYEFPGDYDNDI
ncbi:hypothetical protein HK100_012623 [Physocladia obscura]|uniref:C2H2-type domain-containing protein n=1 Tax=Physocladia obscura TaxID=109957 RepID=A0AAD5T8Z7_9FUNG|nr:hypothetical protein HK100_012623 [Physocladia obscura]